MTEGMDLDTDASLSAIHDIRSAQSYAPTYSDLSSSQVKIDARSAVLIVDTNWLISHLSLLDSVLQTLVFDPNYSPLLLFIPAAVVSELDGLKLSPKREGDQDISTFARRATAWLLENLKTRGDIIRGQRRDETHSKEKIATADDAIMDAALFVRSLGITQNVGLLSDDKNLLVKTTVEGIPCVPHQPGWTAQDFLHFIDPAHAPSKPIEEDMKMDAPTVSILPQEIMQMITATVPDLLAYPIYANLLHHHANDSQDDLNYILSGSKVFINRPVNWRTWDTSDCLRVLDAYWFGSIETSFKTHTPLLAPESPSSSGAKSSRWASPPKRPLLTSTPSSIRPLLIPLIDLLAVRNAPTYDRAAWAKLFSQLEALLQQGVLLDAPRPLWPGYDKESWKGREKAKSFLEQWKSDVNDLFGVA